MRHRLLEARRGRIDDGSREARQRLRDLAVGEQHDRPAVDVRDPPARGAGERLRQLEAPGARMVDDRSGEAVAGGEPRELPGIEHRLVLGVDPRGVDLEAAVDEDAAARVAAPEEVAAKEVVVEDARLRRVRVEEVDGAGREEEAGDAEAEGTRQARGPVIASGDDTGGRRREAERRVERRPRERAAGEATLAAAAAGARPAATSGSTPGPRAPLSRRSPTRTGT